jgi:hypothetical protein
MINCLGNYYNSIDTWEIQRAQVTFAKDLVLGFKSATVAAALMTAGVIRTQLNGTEAILPCGPVFDNGIINHKRYEIRGRTPGGLTELDVIHAIQEADAGCRVMETELHTIANAGAQPIYDGSWTVYVQFKDRI